MSEENRDIWLALPDTALLAQCRVDTMRGTGPGGQKRNKTESAVRLTHLPSGIVAQNDVTRSQHLNKQNALESLRLNIALQIRAVPSSLPLSLPTSPQRDMLWVARILDLLESVGYSLGDAAKSCGVSTARLGRELAKNPHLWEKVNSERAARGLVKLRM